MTGDVFISNEEYLQQQDLVKARQQRIIQVREQSKKMAAAILNRMKLEADRQYQQTENRILSEIRQHYSRELASVRQHYHQCINDINRQHYVKHANASNNSNEKRKQPLKIMRNERNAEQESQKQVSKKPSESQVKEFDTNKTAIDPVNTKKTTVSSVVSKTNLQKSNKSVTEKMPHLPENIIIKPKETNIEFSRDGGQSTNRSPQKKSTNAKKSVNFLNKENFDVDKPHMSTSPIKRYPAYVKKPTLPNPTTTKMNEIAEHQILDDALVEHDGKEIYNLLVHDRIRVLEQKEKILRRQSPMAPAVANSALINKPAKFSEYFSNVRISVTTQNHSAANTEPPVVNLTAETLKKSNGISTDDIGTDVDRVERKKNLLVLELSNAETQTDQNVPSYSTFNCSDEQRNAECKKSVQPIRKSRSPRKMPSLSPIAREVENSDRTQKSAKSKASEKHRCKRKLLKSNDVTVTVSSNPTSASTNSSDSTTVSSAESNVARADHNQTHKTVQVVVNVLSSSKFHEKSPDRQKHVVVPQNELQKVADWRKLFDNEEKMTESSYYSPPEVVVKKQTKGKSRSKKVASDEKSLDLGYYVQKLLLMRPENIETLDVSSCSTVTIDEVNKISTMPARKNMKLPLYQNSFDDTKPIKKSNKLPFYQNSFDDTIDAEFVLKSRSNASNSSSVDDQSVEIFSCVEDDQNSSSVSDSSRAATENFGTPASILKRCENVCKSPRSDPCHSNIFWSVEHSDESEEDQIELPSVEELCRRGFVSEQLLTQKSNDEQETVEEEEFLQQLLSIGQPKTTKKLARHLDFKSSHEKVPRDAEIESQKLTENAADEVDTAAPSDHELRSNSDLKNENRLLGWMGTTVQRTLQASAINSTSSGDSSDPVRHTYKTLENLIEEPLDNSEYNLFHKHFTLSPIKVPDIHLTISPVLKDSE